MRLDANAVRQGELDVGYIASLVNAYLQEGQYTPHTAEPLLERLKSLEPKPKRR